MKVLIACEESQTITTIARSKGIEAYSCDIIPCSGGHPEWHIQDDVLKHLDEDWDLMICHPPCTYLSASGSGWFNEEKHGDKAVQRKMDRIEAYEFCIALYEAPIKQICMENPVGYLNSHFRKPDQIIQPYYFGDTESKRTCLWLKGLPILEKTNIVEPKVYGYHKKGKNIGQPIYGGHYQVPSKERSKIRSKTFPGIANAMVDQWMVNNA